MVDTGQGYSTDSMRQEGNRTPFWESRDSRQMRLRLGRFNLCHARFPAAARLPAVFEPKDFGSDRGESVDSMTLASRGFVE